MVTPQKIGMASPRQMPAVSEKSAKAPKSPSIEKILNGAGRLSVGSSDMAHPS
jgi:hypothetical protein